MQSMATDIFFIKKREEMLRCIYVVIDRSEKKNAIQVKFILWRILIKLQ